MSYTIGVPDKTRSIWAEMKDIQTELDRFIEAPFKDELSIVVILGDYGAGKTHSLNYIRHAIIKKKGKKLKVIPFDYPFSNFILFLEKLESFLPLEEIFSLVKQSIEKRKSNVVKILKEGYDNEILDSVLIFERARDLVLKTVYPDINPDLRIILARLIATETQEIFDLAKKWLIGGPLTPNQLRELGVSGKITTSNAADISADYLRIYVSEGGRIVILIDEFEDLGVIGTRQSLVDFRHFLDRNLPRLKIVITLTDAAFEGIRTGRSNFVRKGYPPLHSRLNASKKIRLSNLNKKKTKEFILEYLVARNKALNGKVRVSRKTVGAIHNRTDGSPRLLASLCQNIALIEKFNGRLEYRKVYKVMDDLDFKPETPTEDDEPPIITI